MAGLTTQQYRRRVMDAIREGKIPASQGQMLINNAQGLANRNGVLSPNNRREVNRQLNSAVRFNESGGGSGGDDGQQETDEERRAREEEQRRQEEERRRQEEQRLREEERQRQTQQQRTSARGILENLFSQLGFTDADRAALMRDVDGWISEGLADVGTDAIMVRFRDTDVYKNRFQGMQALRERGQAITEAEYVQMERSYRRVLSSYNLPSEFYDNYDDYAKFIAADVSAQELEDRVVAARQVLDNANSMVLDELREYYNVDDGTAMSFLLGLTDADGVARQSVRSQQEIRSGLRAAQVGGAAERAGFSMGRSQSELLAGSTVGQTLDPFNPQTSAQLESTFNRARRTANRERTLAGIDQEAYTEMDTLQAAFGDDEKMLASERRARRERARFSGTAGAARSALSQSRNF